MIVFFSFRMHGIDSMSLVSVANIDLPLILCGMERIYNFRGPDGQVQWLDEKQGLALGHKQLDSRLE